METWGVQYTGAYTYTTYIPIYRKRKQTNSDNRVSYIKVYNTIIKMIIYRPCMYIPLQYRTGTSRSVVYVYIYIFIDDKSWLYVWWAYIIKGAYTTQCLHETVYTTKAYLASSVKKKKNARNTIKLIVYYDIIII